MATIDLALAGSSQGTFLSDGSFTTGNTGTLLASVIPAYTLTNVQTGGTGITAEDAKHAWTVELGTATTSYNASKYGDKIVLNPAGVAGTITLGAGKDTIDATAAAAGVNVALSGYDYNSDLILLGSTTKVFQDSLSSAGVLDGGAGDKLQLEKIDGVYKAHVSLKAASSDFYVWKGSTDAQEIDASSETHSLYMVAGDKSDTLIGGSKGDTIIATVAGAYAFGGAGSDSIVLESGKTSRQFVAMSTDSGRDEVDDFGAGFTDANDVLVLRDGSVGDISFADDGTDTSIKLDGGRVTLKALTAAGVGGVQLLAQDKDGAISKVAGLKAGANYIAAGSDDLADYYIGEGKAEVSFQNIDDDVVVDLGNTGNIEDKATFKNIVSVIGGKGKTSLVGAADVANQLTATAGSTTLWGGGSANDTLVGNAASADAFFIGQGDGKDTITTFQAGIDTSAASPADAVYMMNSPVAELKNDGANTTLTFGDGSSVVLKGTAAGAAATENDAIRFTLDGEKFQSAIVGTSTKATNFTYSSDVDMFFGGSKNDTLTVGAGYDASSVDIRLNNTGAKSFSSVDIIDASAYDGKALLAGNDGASESLIGGKGKTTLWGGIGGEDTLTGTSGDVTSFYFGANNGADVITASDSDDKVIFYDLATTDLASVDTSGSKLVFNFNDGSSLSLNNYAATSVNTFQFTDGTYTYDKATKTATLKS